MKPIKMRKLHWKVETTMLEKIDGEWEFTPFSASVTYPNKIFRRILDCGDFERIKGDTINQMRFMQRPGGVMDPTVEGNPTVEETEEWVPLITSIKQFPEE